MKNVLLVVLFMIGVVGYSVGKNVRLHGSLKEFGTNVVSMDFDGAAGEISKEWSQKIMVNKDGSFDFSFDLKKPGYYSVGRNTLYLTPGDDMEVYLGTSQPQSWFKGKGADVNNYMKGRLFPKAGSFLEAGRNVKGSFEETKKYIDERAAQREKELKALPNASKEFVELEMCVSRQIWRIVIWHIYGILILLKDCKTREEGGKVANDFNKSIREYINPLLKEISAKDQYLEVAVVRDVLLSCYDMDASIFDFPKSQRLKELNDAYVTGERMDEEMTKPLYDELHAFGSKLKNADFKQAFMGRLEKRAKLMEGRPAIDFAVVDMNGKEGKLSDYKGKVLFVDFWATWCMPCLGEMPFFNELSKKYPNVQFVGVSLDDNTEVWLNKLKGDSDHGKVLELFSKDPLVRTGWDITGIPRFLLIDKDFTIIAASAPRPSQKDVITPLLEKYNK